MIEPAKRITVAAPIEGVVETVLVDRGDPVKKGDVLARLESSVETARLRAARTAAKASGLIRSREARLAFATSELGRQQRLDARNVAARSDVEEARTSKEVAEAELVAAKEERKAAEHEYALARAALERRTIRSPISGVVIDRLLSPGEYADPPHIVEIAQVDPLRVEVFAPLSLFGKVTRGSTVEIVTESPLSARHGARVTVVDPIVDSASGTFRVRLELPNPKGTIPAGLQCRAHF